MSTVAAPDLRALTIYELADTYDQAADDAARARVVAEVTRRDRADRMATARRALGRIRHEAECAVHAQYLAASEWTRGRLVSREGMAAGIRERDLWRLPAERAARFWSEELADYFMFVEPRITVTGYMRARAAENRAAQIEATETEEVTTDEHEHDASGPELARDAARSLRHVPAAAEAPQAGAGRAVRRGRRRTVTITPWQAVRPGTGRPGGSVQRTGRTGLNGRRLTYTFT